MVFRLVNMLVVGLGEVGSALFKIIAESKKFNVFGYDIDPSKTIHKIEEIPPNIEYIHICIPFVSTEKYVKIVTDYASKFSPKIIFLHSTVAPGTSRKVYEATKIPVIFTPIRGKHPYLKKHILFWPKWVVSIPPQYSEDGSKILSRIGLKTKIYKGPPETIELAKIFETVYRALLIAWWQEMHRIARHFGADLCSIAEFIGEVHKVLYDRPILYPGVIGGHCLIPNTKILKSQYESIFLDAILSSNEKRQKEVDNQDILNEIKKLKEIAMKYTNPKYYEGGV